MSNSLQEYIAPFKTEILDELFDGIYILDRNRVIRFWNRGAEQISGYSRQNIVGKICNLSPLEHEDASKCRLCHEKCPALQVMETAKPLIEVIYLHHADGRLVPVETHIRPLLDQNQAVIGAIEIFRDITHWKELEFVTKEKDTLMGVLAHDIRNPLSVVQAYAHILRRESENRLKEIGEALLRRSTFALALVNDLLNSQAIANGSITVNIEEVHPEKVAQESINNFSSTAEIKFITLSLQNEALGLTLIIDPVRLEEIFNNLISNAIHYSPPGKTVTILLRAYSEGAEFLIIDQGIGIKPEDQSHLFKAFGKTTNRTTAGESSHGLGLYIVKRIVDLFAGSISLHSVPGEGSTFIVRIPKNGCAINPIK